MKLKKKPVRKKSVSAENSMQKLEPIVAKAEKEESEKLSFGELRLSEVLDRAISISERCSDYVCDNPADEMFIKNEGNLFSLNYIDHAGHQHDGYMTKYSLGQFGAKIGVPSQYLQKCVTRERPDIAQYNVKEWLKHYEKPLFVRHYDNTIRGVLSDRYSVCDTPDILEGVDKVLDLGNFTVRGNFVSPERFHIRLADKEQMSVSGEDLFSGFTIDSSDVGRSTLSVRFLVYKKVCSNGLIIGKSSSQMFKQKHIGITANDFRTGLEQGFEMYPVIASKVREQIERTRNSDCPFNFNYESDEELEKLIDSIRNNTKVLSPKGAEKVIDIMQSKKYEQNRWGYVNALTEVAQDLTLEKRLSLETYAGALLVA